MSSVPSACVCVARRRLIVCLFDPVLSITLSHHFVSSVVCSSHFTLHARHFR